MGLTAIRPVRRETLQTAVYEQLCELILAGDLVPGDSITVAHIAKAFDVSPMPVREAISRLMAAGALTIVSGRSIGVPHLDKAEFTDLRNVRLELETVALKWAIEKSTPSFTAELNKKLEAMVDAERASGAKNFIRANYEFHFSIYRQAGSDILLDIISDIWLRINPHFHLLQKSGHYPLSNDRHREIVSGILGNDPDKATAALKADINGAYKAMISANLG